jgi:hypothetical protein
MLAVSLSMLPIALRHRRAQTYITMSKKQVNALREIARNVKKNSPIIRRKLRAAGMKPDPTFVFVAAKYYSALNRLARE